MWIPEGAFQMGCVRGDRDCDPAEEPRHRVTLTRGFYLMTHEATVALVGALAATSGVRPPRQPLWNESDEAPVVNVTWEEAVRVCTGLGGRLPTEAEWEHAARGGRSGRRHTWDGRFRPDLANGVGRRRADRWFQSAPVGSFPPNQFGLFDMIGNVWEWVNDWYDSKYYAASPERDPPGPASGDRRVIRGGSWDSTPLNLRISARSALSPAGRHNFYVGFRCAADGPHPPRPAAGPSGAPPRSSHPS